MMVTADWKHLCTSLDQRKVRFSNIGPTSLVTKVIDDGIGRLITNNLNNLKWER